MSISNLTGLYQNKSINKQEFIKKMHEFHKYLFQYRDLLKDNAIKKIEIDENSVIMSFHDSALKMFVDEYDERTAPIEALNFNGYENEETNIILELIGNSLHSDYTVFDIGANIGWYSLILAKKFPHIKIHAFEPIPKTFNHLNENIRLNSIENITTNNFGLSNENKEVTFYYYKEGSGNSSLASLSDQYETEKIQSNVYMLDNYININNLHIDFMKCDVEGAELFVFKGGFESLKRYKPIVFTEMLRKWASKFDYHPNEIISLFTSIGYACFTISGNKLKSFNFMDENTIETNFFFLHNEKHLHQIEKFTEI